MDFRSNFLGVILFFLSISWVNSQKIDTIIGSVSFVTKSHVYVKFSSTESLSVGDTLDILDGDVWKKSLVIEKKSSTSCVTQSFTEIPLEVGNSVKMILERSNDLKEQVIPLKDDKLEHPASPQTLDTLGDDTSLRNKKKKPTTTGRLTLSTNASLNPDNLDNFQRMRASFSLQMNKIQQSNFSFQTYMTYRHRFGIDQLNSEFFDDFKVLTLAVMYAPSEKFSASLGRKIIPAVANIGSVDGLHSDFSFGHNTIGAFIGSRPDISNYSLNLNLPQFGAYYLRNHGKIKGVSTSTVAFAEQKYNSKTDRRYAYFQHSNSSIKNLSFFFSTEFDLFQNINDTISNQPKLTSIYTSIRYRVRRNLSFSANYDNRRNVIYYESNQTYISQLLAQETRQGFRLQGNYSPFRKIALNVSAFYRFQGDKKPTKNYIGNVNFSGILRKSTFLSLNTNYIESYYFNGTTIGGRLSDNFAKGKFTIELNYRNVNYKFLNEQPALRQNIGGLSCTYMLTKTTSLLWSYEGTFEPSKVWHRYFITLTQRIKN